MLTEWDAVLNRRLATMADVLHCAFNLPQECVRGKPVRPLNRVVVRMHLHINQGKF
jgi:hypothetical protein